MGHEIPGLNPGCDPQRNRLGTIATTVAAADIGIYVGHTDDIRVNGHIFADPITDLKWQPVQERSEVLASRP